jgi:diguanylate cyclase (GGDEF)-like protein
MTLYRQIILSICLLFVLGFIGTVLISTENLRVFLVAQLESHAQDTATSLGLSLSPPMHARDMPVINSMVDAIFDRGYYQDITINTIDGEELLKRTKPAGIGQVPDWFIDAVSLDPPTANALVMSGWKQAASVYVTSHPGHAYTELWVNTVDTFWLFFVSASVILALAMLAVKIMLRPLRQVEIQADAICNRSYPIQKKLPRTRELRQVVMAMNRLSEKVSSIFTEQSSLTERLREQAYKDPVTGLGNRRYFNRQVQSQISSHEDSTQGAFLMIELHGLVKVNELSGYIVGDQLLQRAGELVQTQLKDIENCFTARISGASFGVVVVGTGKDEAEMLAENFCGTLLQLRADGLVDVEDIAHIGIAMWKQGDTLPGLLSEADIALRAAQSKGQNTWQRYEPPAVDQAQTQGSEHWRTFLQQTIRENNICLYTQPVLDVRDCASGLEHKEVLLRIPDHDGVSITAGVFMPMAERLGLTSEIDKLAISKLFSHIESTNDDATVYAVNLSSASLHDPVFIQWLCSSLEKSPALSKRILVEFPEYGVLRNMQTSRQVIERLEATGCHCGIDHFGRGFYSFGYLHSLRVRYLKVDSSYTRDIDKEDDNQFFMQALTDTAHSIDMLVIAQAIESDGERKTIESLNLDGIQGYLTGKPEAL